MHFTTYVHYILHTCTSHIIDITDVHIPSTHYFSSLHISLLMFNKYILLNLLKFSVSPILSWPKEPGRNNSHYHTDDYSMCFSTLKRIKPFLRNTMAQDRLNALAMLPMEKNLIQLFLTLTQESMRSLPLRKTAEQSSCTNKSCHSPTHTHSLTRTHTHSLVHSHSSSTWKYVSNIKLYRNFVL